MPQSERSTRQLTSNIDSDDTFGSERRSVLFIHLYVSDGTRLTNILVDKGLSAKLADFPGSSIDGSPLLAPDHP